jgi:hypothetical protein
MEVKSTKIMVVDLKKLLKESNIKSLRHLANIAKVDYTTLTKCEKGIIKMSEEMWNKIKFFI